MTPQELAWFKEQEREINAWRVRQDEPKKEVEDGNLQ